MDTKTFTLRPPAEADIPAIMAMSSQRQRLLGEESTISEHDIRFEWNMPGHDRERHNRVVEIDGRLVGRAGIGVQEAARSGQLYGGGYVVPEHRGKGIGTALLGWLLDTARSEPGAEELMTGVNVKETEAVAFLESNGFEHQRTFYWMVHPDPASVPDPRWPDGTTVDDSLRGDELIAAIVEAHDNSFIDHWNFHPMNAEEIAHWMEHPDVDPEMCFIGRGPNGEIGGYNWCFIEKGDAVRRGVIGQLGTVRAFRGIGLGKALFVHGIRELVKRDPTEIGIGVDSENPTGALQLYEGVGFRTKQENRNYRIAL